LGSTIEFWQADPDGSYDNSSSEMKYRCAITVGQDGNYSLETLLPGRYLNGTQYRPHHIHVKIWDAEGVEVLVTQLYFDGDEYLECDGFANRSLVIPFEGSLDTEVIASDVDFIV
jgi:protocatechuate 3,4-dioxygenase beta subunit